MCELQFIKRIDNKNLNDNDLSEFFKLMQFGSLNNSDAFGFFNHNLTYKNKGLFSLNKFNDFKVLKKENFLIGHNRYMTTTNNQHNKNNHPFILNDFVLSHNGVINNEDELKTEFNFLKPVTTDSFLILYLINHYFKISKNKIRVNKIKDAIQKTTLKLNGSFSVFLYDKIDKNIFYFKNSKTEFKFCLIDNKYLCGSTKQNNLRFLFLKNFKSPILKYQKIEDNKIYLINDNEILKDIGVFKELKPSVINEFWGYSGYTTNKKTTKKGYKQSLKKDLSYLLKDMFGFTPSFNVHNDLIIIDTNQDNYLINDIINTGINYNINKNYIELDISDFLLMTEKY